MNTILKFISHRLSTSISVCDLDRALPPASVSCDLFEASSLEVPGAAQL